jgi:cell division protein FtsA
VVGIGSHPSRGLKKGVVVNIESTVQSIQRAVDEAERMAGCKIHSVYTGISGSHIRGLNSHGVTAIKNREVTQEDVERVIEAARVVAIPATRRFCISCPGNSSSTVRKASRTRWACPGCGWRCGFTS